ncbi:MAG: hypothetical protein H6656_11950 [Ardenticatenaceae bacterium]|nr:hypothetical protein [Ardenticatenaceae bacterium]
MARRFFCTWRRCCGRWGRGRLAAGRAWGGLLNAVAILWFMGQMAHLAATAQKVGRG